MGSVADPARDRISELLRNIPPVDELLALPELAGLATRLGRDLIVQAARAVLDERRQNIRLGLTIQTADRNELARLISAEVTRLLSPSLRAVINATGVILHTNLGRAPLSDSVIRRIRETAGSYTNLE